MVSSVSSTGTFRAARDFLLEQREDYDAAYREFRWPELERVQLGARLVRRRRRAATDRPGAADRRGATAARRAAPSPSCRARSDQVAAGCAPQGVAPRRPDAADARQPGRAVGDDARGDEARRGDHPGHHRCSAGPTCATGSSAATRAHVIATRPTRGEVRRACPAATPRIAVGDAGRRLAATTRDGRQRSAADFDARRRRRGADDPLLLYFTSGTTAQPKLVEHTHASATRSATCRRCTGSACGPATCT